MGTKATCATLHAAMRAQRVKGQGGPLTLRPLERKRDARGLLSMETSLLPQCLTGGPLPPLQGLPYLYYLCLSKLFFKLIFETFFILDKKNLQHDHKRPLISSIFYPLPLHNWSKISKNKKLTLVQYY